MKKSKHFSFYISINFNRYVLTLTFLLLFRLFGFSQNPNSDQKASTKNINQKSNSTISIDIAQTYQTIEGFGAGIKRQTNNLFDLPDNIRQQIETYCFKDLEANMIRFFIYHNLEDAGNDNNDPFLLDDSQLDWSRYEDNDNQTKYYHVSAALNNAFALSTNGFDEIIGNCNSAPGWMKKNNSHKRFDANEDVLLNTLKDGMLDEFSEFIVAFVKGMKAHYNIDVTAVSPTNEPDYLNTYESMNLTPTELIDVLSNLNSRFDSEGLSNIKIVSPENATISPKNSTNLTSINSATNYMNIIFSDTQAKNAVDVVATHTYFNSNHDANWSGLKSVSSNKPIWVTESANLNTDDRSMTDAKNYVKWMLNGFNNGGMTAYMIHLFYENIKEDGSSSGLVVWDNANTIYLPKRYYVFKHFTNLIKRGYKRIQSSTSSSNTMVGAFKSDDNSKVVVQILNDGASQTITLNVPQNATGLVHYCTSDVPNQDFTTLNDITLNPNDTSISFTAGNNSLHSIVYTLDASLAVKDRQEKLASMSPNPARNDVSIMFKTLGDYEIYLYQVNGVQMSHTVLNNQIQKTIDISRLPSGIYFFRVVELNKSSEQTLKLIKL